MSGEEAGTKVLPEGKTVTVNANATIKLVQGLSFVTIKGEGKTLVTGTYTYGIAGANGVASDLTTKTVEVAEGGVLQFRAWRAYALTIDSLIVNGTLKREGYDGSDVPTVTVAQGQKLSGTGTIEIPVTLADGALVGNAEVVPATAVVQGSVTCDNEEIANALKEKLTPPTGYHFNVSDKVLSIALNKVNVTIPAAPANTKWYDADGNVVEAGTIAVDPNTNVTLTLKADEGYVFADGTTSTTVTVNAGGTGATVETPDVTAATPVAEVNGTKYQTLDAAIAAAGADDEVLVVTDIATDAAFVVTKKVAINLNGKTIAATEKDTEGNGVFWVKAGGELTLNGEGTINGVGGNAYNIAIWADGGKVIINGGTYTNVGAQDSGPDGAHFDLIYAKNGGSVEINGGTFKCQTPNWTLNSHDTAKGTIVVKGGTFYQFNPSDCTTEGTGTNFCAANYRVEADGDLYLVKEGYTVTETSVATVTADTEAEALAQVDFSVTTPEGVDAAAYKNYFKLVATETAEGSKTWTVALALKDELKPVIAETTPAITFNKDGTVTVNIKNELPGLYYGVRYATTVEAVETTAPVAGFTVTPAKGNTAGFFKVVVDFKEIK